MVQVDDEGVVAEGLEGFVVVAVHVADQKVQHGHVNEVGQAAALVVGRRVADVFITVVRIGLPGCFAPLVVRPAVGMPPHLFKK